MFLPEGTAGDLPGQVDDFPARKVVGVDGTGVSYTPLTLPTIYYV